MFQLNNMFALVFSILFINIQGGSGARILATVCTPSFSHQVAFRQIWKELAKRGHDLVLITTDPMKGNIENLRQIDASSSYNLFSFTDLNTMIANGTFENPVDLVKQFLKMAMIVNKHQLQLPEVKQLINNKTETFDLLMTELLFPAHLGLLERFRVPAVGLASLDAPIELHDLMGNDGHPVLYPESYIMPTIYPLTFWQRIMNQQDIRAKVGKRKNWDMNVIESAVNAVKCKEMGYLKASKTFGIPRRDTDDDIDEDDEDAECLYCNNLYSEDTKGEAWIKCSLCFRWCHEECAGFDKNKTFICEICLDG